MFSLSLICLSSASVQSTPARSQDVDHHMPTKGFTVSKATPKAKEVMTNLVNTDEYSLAEASGDYSSVDMTKVTSICPPFERKSKFSTFL